MSGKEFIKAFNDAEIIQDSWEEELEFPEKVRKEWCDLDPEILNDGLDIDKHRWYETSITYYKVNDGTIIGFRLVTDIYSEVMTVSDCCWKIKAFEGEEFTITSYRPKKE